MLCCIVSINSETLKVFLLIKSKDLNFPGLAASVAVKTTTAEKEVAVSAKQHIVHVEINGPCNLSTAF